MIDCREVLRRCYEYLDGELPAEHADQLSAHLERCRACFDRVEFERQFGAFLRQQGRVETDPRELQARIRARLSELEPASTNTGEELFPNHADRAPIDSVAVPRLQPGVTPSGPERMPMRRAIGRPVWSYLLAAAAILMVAVPILRHQGGVRTASDMLGELRALHETDLPEIRESDPGRMAEWIESRLTFDPHIEAFTQAGYEISGAATSGSWTHLFAQSDGVPVSVFMATGQAFTMPAGLQDMARDGLIFKASFLDGYAVVICEWQPPRGVVCVTMARTDLQSLVERVVRMEKLRLGI